MSRVGLVLDLRLVVEVADRLTAFGGGLLDVPGVLAQLDRRDYAGWLMSEQDTTWNPSSESAAASRRVLAYALRTLPGGQR